MTPDQVIEILTRHRQGLEHLGVKSLSLFGSVARSEAGPDSDVDLLVEFSHPVGMFAFLRTRRYLEEILGASVDLVTRDALRPTLRDAILREAIRAA
ncbi:MAG: nucleotidyltransferase family protein [Deltaproteobacteria bacterium]|nr:nucleotidyltransferase family protein [Deltaproteobacteria bacterium]